MQFAEEDRLMLGWVPFWGLILTCVEELPAEEFIEHGPGSPGVPASVTMLKTYVTMLRKAFPDLHYTLEVLVAEGSLVAGRMTGTGTQLGEFLEIPATGKHVRWTETYMARYADGKLVEHWVDADHLGILRQLGAVPPPG